MRRPLIVAFTVLFVAALACQSLTDETVETGEQAETLLPQATALAESPIETPEAAAPGDVLLQDDFSDAASGWAETSTSAGTMGYLDGGYHINVNEPFSPVFSTPGQSSYADVSVEVDVRRIGGDDSCTGEGCTVSTYGLICRYQDQDNFYGAGISGSYHGLFGFAGGELHYFGKPGLFSSGEDFGLNPGDASNHIRLDCVGDYLALYVNGELLDEEYVEFSLNNVDVIASGDVGLYVRSSNTATDILFDNFVVTQP